MSPAGAAESAAAEGIRTEGIVLRRIDYGDTSQIAHLFTAATGRVPVIARGGRRPTPALRGPLDLFVLAEVDFRRRSRSDLHLLTRYRVLTGHPGLRAAASRLEAAFAAAEIVLAGTRELDPAPELFADLAALLRGLETASPSGTVTLLLSFMASWLRTAGFRPEMDRCRVCGAGLPDGAAARLEPGRGGVVCGSCGGVGRTLRLEPAARAVLRRLLALSVERAGTLRLTAAQQQAVRVALTVLVEDVIERPLLALRCTGGGGPTGGGTPPAL